MTYEHSARACKKKNQAACWPQNTWSPQAAFFIPRSTVPFSAYASSVRHSLMVLVIAFPWLSGYTCVANDKKEADRLWQRRKIYAPRFLWSSTPKYAVSGSSGNRPPASTSQSYSWNTTRWKKMEVRRLCEQWQQDDGLPNPGGTVPADQAAPGQK